MESRPNLTLAQEEALELMNREIQRHELLDELKSQEALLPFLQARREVFKAFPSFWPLAFSNHPPLSQYLRNKEDVHALSFLEDLWIEHRGLEKCKKEGGHPREFTIEFYFKENPFFSDKVLKKQFKVEHKPEPSLSTKADENGISDALVDFQVMRDYVPQPTKINWIKPDKALTKLYPLNEHTGSDQMEVGASPSFFHFFEAVEWAFPIGISIVSELFPDATEFIHDNSAFLDEELDSNEAGSDEDEDEKPAAKKARQA